MIDKVSIFLIILFAIIATFLIGLGIINLIDKKISNVAVNIPPIKITQPNLRLTVSKEDVDKIKLCSCENKTMEFNYDTDNIEGFGNIKRGVASSNVKADYANTNTQISEQIAKPQLYDIKAYNYIEYANVPAPFNVNQLRILNKNMRGLAPEHVREINVPEGWNYAFENI